MEQRGSSRPLSYEEPVDTKAAPVRPPRPSKDITRHKVKETKNVDKFDDIPLDSSTGPVYDDPDEDAGSGSESLDSYEVPIRASARQEDHTYRAMFESSIKSDDYYANT